MCVRSRTPDPAAVRQMPQAALRDSALEPPPLWPVEQMDLAAAHLVFGRYWMTLELVVRESVADESTKAIWQSGTEQTEALLALAWCVFRSC
jgi:hypothetical protein